MKNKVVIIGCGNVGMSYAYALLNQRTSVNELVLIDLNKDRIEGEVMDLNHCLAFAPSKIDIKVGEYSDCRDASIVVIAAGANQNSGETRMDLINKNMIGGRRFMAWISLETKYSVGEPRVFNQALKLVKINDPEVKRYQEQLAQIITK